MSRVAVECQGCGCVLFTDADEAEATWERHVSLRHSAPRRVVYPLDAGQERSDRAQRDDDLEREHAMNTAEAES